MNEENIQHLKKLSIEIGLIAKILDKDSILVVKSTLNNISCTLYSLADKLQK